MPGIAAGLAANAIGAGMGLLLEGHNDRRQLRQQQELQNMQMKGQKEMTDYNLAKQMELWNATNYKAQMAQMAKAGLNPALMYGTGGPGGTTQAAQGQGPTGGNAPTGGMEVMNMMMQKAQIQLLEAQTQKTKAETTNIPKTGQNIDADTALKEVNTQIQQIQPN